jgi:anti-anti-sigma factor
VRLITEVVDHVGVIRVSGELEAMEAQKLTECAAGLLGDGARSLVIDLADVTFMDSSGLNALIEARSRAEMQLGTVTVRNPTSFVQRLLHITGLELLCEDGDGAS